MRLKGILIALAVVGLAAPAFAQEYSDKELKMIGEGRALFLQQCASCHGNLAREPAAETNGDTTTTPDLRLIATRDGRFNRLHVTNHIRFGTQSYHHAYAQEGEMPSWSRALISGGRSRGKAECDFQKVVRYLEFAQIPPAK